MSKSTWGPSRSTSFNDARNKFLYEEEDLSEKELYYHKETAIKPTHLVEIEEKEHAANTQYRNIFFFITYFVFCCLGGILQSLSSWLEQFKAIDNSVPYHLLDYLLLGSVPLTIVVMFLYHSHCNDDPKYIKRFFFYSLITLSDWLVQYIPMDETPYINMGSNHGIQAYCSPNGPFDYLIGHKCTQFGYLATFLLDLIGMSITGFMKTLNCGFLLFCFGFGWEYMFCGGLLGVFAAIISLFGDIMTTPLGMPALLFIDGFWRWGVLITCIVGRRKNPVNRVGITDAFWLVILITDALLISSSYGTSIVIDKEARRYPLIGFISTTVLYISMQLLYIVYLVFVTKSFQRLDYLVLTDTEEEENQMIPSVARWLLTHQGSDRLASIPPPWKYIWLFLRWVLMSWTTWTFGLFCLAVVYNRLMVPCGKDWEVPQRNGDICPQLYS